MSKKLNLMLHCGSHAATLDEVKAVSTPDAVDRYQPISHWYLIDQLMKRLPTFGMEIVEQAHGLFHNRKSGTVGDRYFGLFQVEPVSGNGDASDDFSVVFGLRNSHDKTFAAGLCCGSGVFVCDNLSFSAEIVLARRHTTNILNDLPRIVNTAVGRLVDARHSQAQRIEAYKATSISDVDAKALAVDMVKAGAINKTNILDVVNEWENPRHDEFADKTIWSLFNDTTEVLKKTSLVQLPNRTTNLHALCDAACGLTIDAKAAIRDDLADLDDLTVAV